MRVTDKAAGTGGCTDPKYCQNGQPKPPKPPRPSKDDSDKPLHHNKDKDDAKLPSTTTGTQPSPVISAVGVVLLVQLGILDTLLSIGVASVAVAAVTVPGAQIGLVGELVLIPLDFVSFNLTIYAAQMAATGSPYHDPLPILHAVAPNILPYKP